MSDRMGRTDALIFAGGTGSRMNGGGIPKQFLKLGGKPIIIHTIERFAQHPLVDHVTVACLKGWIEFLESCLATCSYRHAVDVVAGGASSQQSIFRGLEHIRGLCGEGRTGIVLVHDGVRPLIDEQTIGRCIESVIERGPTVTVAPAIETIVTQESGRIVDIVDRARCRLARAPQGFVLDDLYSAHLRAQGEGHEFIDSISMMAHYGHAIFTVDGPVENIKVTTPTDYFSCKSFFDMHDYSGLWE